MAKRLDDQLKNLILVKVTERLKEFRGQTAKAGFFPGQQYHPSGTNVAYVAAIQNYGDPTHKIPASNFMGKAASENREQWIEEAKRGVRAVIARKADPDAVLEKLGGAIAADIQSAIADTDRPPLSPVTVMLRGMKQHDANLRVTGKTVGEAARRVDEGKTNYGASDQPLNDTEYMLKSVTHKVGSAS